MIPGTPNTRKAKDTAAPAMTRFFNYPRKPATETSPKVDNLRGVSYRIESSVLSSL